MYCIYRIINRINGKTYIGQHKYKKLNDNYMGSGIHIKRAIKKYGIENFKKEILEFDIPNVDLANDWEQMYILFERAKGKAEYNIANGGKGSAGFHHSEEYKRLLSETMKGNTINKGKHHSEETKKKISEYKKGKKLSEEHRRHISENLKGRVFSEDWKKKISDSKKGDRNPMYGKRYTDEEKMLLSEKNKGKNKGKKRTDEERKKMSEAKKGKHWKLVDGKRVWY